jgi:hypothetical protein
MNLASISDAQRTPMKWANWFGTVHHGLPEDPYTANVVKRTNRLSIF